MIMFNMTNKSVKSNIKTFGLNSYVWLTLQISFQSKMKIICFGHIYRKVIMVIWFKKCLKKDGGGQQRQKT